MPTFKTILKTIAIAGLLLATATALLLWKEEHEKSTELRLEEERLLAVDQKFAQCISSDASLDTKQRLAKSYVVRTEGDLFTAKPIDSAKYCDPHYCWSDVDAGFIYEKSTLSLGYLDEILEALALRCFDRVYPSAPGEKARDVFNQWAIQEQRVRWFQGSVAEQLLKDKEFFEQYKKLVDTRRMIANRITELQEPQRVQQEAELKSREQKRLREIFK